MPRISAFVFDLDGTLVQTEKLKALSYAKATVELCPYTVTEDQVIEAFKDYVGLSREDVAQGLIERFRLVEKIAPRMEAMGAATPWEVFVQVRLRYYDEIIAHPQTLRGNLWPHNVDLLKLAKERACATALATMSHREQVEKVLDILALRDQFHCVATRDDVQKGKPDPEIYVTVARWLNLPPEQILVIEDSPNGVRAAMAAGMNVLAVSTPFTREQLHQLDILDPRFIIDEPATQLMPAVREFTKAL